MQNARTTTCGAIAAAALAVAMTDGLPSWVHVTAIVVAAAANGALGFFAKDATPP